MSDAELSVRLFLAGLAVAVFALGASQAGWRHRAFITILFASSAIFAAAAIWYPALETRLPNAASSAEALASDVRLWFGLVVLLAITVLVLTAIDAARMRQQVATPSRTITTIPPVTASSIPTALEVLPEARSDLNAQELMAACKDRTDIEAEQFSRPRIGKLSEVSGIVFNVGRTTDERGTISVEFESDIPGLVIVRLSGRDQMTRASSLKRGDKINVSGQIAEISRTSVALNNSEFSRA